MRGRSERRGLFRSQEENARAERALNRWRMGREDLPGRLRINAGGTLARYRRFDLVQIDTTIRRDTSVMQYLIVVFALLGCAFAQFGSFRGFPSQNAYRQTPRPPVYQPQQPQYTSPGRFIAIRNQQKDTYPDGTYSFSYDTENGISVQESGRPQGTGQGQSEVVQGRFSYSAPDGTPITLEYTADENGFHPQGAHLPTPPPIPEAIRRALAANPPRPDQTDYRDAYQPKFGGQSFNAIPFRRY